RRADLGLSEVDRRLLEKHHLTFVHGGAKLSPADKERLRELNEQLAALSTDFERDLLAANKAGQQVFDSAEQLAGLPAGAVAAAVANAGREAEALRAHLPAGQSLEAWDWTYYSEKVRLAEYDVDSEALRPYLELDNVLVNGVFRAAQLVYGLSFTARPDLVG